MMENFGNEEEDSMDVDAFEELNTKPESVKNAYRGTLPLAATSNSFRITLMTLSL